MARPLFLELSMGIRCVACQNECLAVLISLLKVSHHVGDSTILMAVTILKVVASGGVMCNHMMQNSFGYYPDDSISEGNY
jgi:hypothetical protein